MAIIVEDGSMVTSANSYVTEIELTAFATARSVTLVATAEVLLIKAMDYIESLAFIGTKYTSTQSLQWPRGGAYVDSYLFSYAAIPQALKNGLMQCAIAIDQSNDPLQDISRATVREKVGDIEVEYNKSASSVVRNRKILIVLAKLLAAGSGSNTINVNKG